VQAGPHLLLARPGAGFHTQTSRRCRQARVRGGCPRARPPVAVGGPLPFCPCQRRCPRCQRRLCALDGRRKVRGQGLARGRCRVAGRQLALGAPGPRPASPGGADPVVPAARRRVPPTYSGGGLVESPIPRGHNVPALFSLSVGQRPDAGRLQTRGRPPAAASRHEAVRVEASRRAGGGARRARVAQAPRINVSPQLPGV